ncbi:UDP-glucosyltransferase 2-like isoform X1 [Choristoneura fumiferana]|uniref:UDP-glucosyltransferase 2-like isoform X1 n=2 Tax=Choristoneura fumiferana TaxID=7141 RepID=UPI003D157019
MPLTPMGVCSAEASASQQSTKMKFQYLSVTILILKCLICESAKILYVMPFTARSHYIGMKNLALELASRGHDVYAITPFREPEAPLTYHQLMVSNVSFWTKLFDVQPKVFDMIDYSFESFQTITAKSGFLVNEHVFESEDVQNFLKQDHKIDLVITEIFFNEGLYMFAHKYQAPLVLVTTVGNSFKGNYYMRNPLQLSTLFHEYGRASEPLSFLGRFYNMYLCTFDLLMLKFWYFPRQQESALRYFKDLPQPVPNLEDIAANAALLLLNSHFSIDNPSAYLPNIIEVGGLHIKDTNDTLPADLQNVLDNAKNGVVFLSFGSNVQLSELDKDKLDAFLKVFGELKQTVLMKWEDVPIQNIPKNIVLRKWFPQKAVLAHHNVKLFIGHGGLLGLQETISAGVPILGVPVFGDQYLNILDTVRKGHGEILYYKEINENTLRTKINKMLKDRTYMETAKKIAARFKDRPMNPLDTAVWWTEYVIRHKGADFMKPPKISYIAYQMLDVYLFLLGVVAVIIYVILKVITLIINVFGSKNVTKKQKKT